MRLLQRVEWVLAEQAGVGVGMSLSPVTPLCFGKVTGRGHSPGLMEEKASVGWHFSLQWLPCKAERPAQVPQQERALQAPRLNLREALRGAVVTGFLPQALFAVAVGWMVGGHSNEYGRTKLDEESAK